MRRRFDDPTLEQRIPDPVLRAAAVSLLGTIAQPALDWLSSGKRFERVELGTVAPAIAKSFTDPDGRQRIVVDRRFRFEQPALLSVVLAHEALHSDDRVADLEELVATALQALVHIEQLLADPTLANERTELAQATNAWVVIRLNTRRAGSPELHLVLDDDGPTVLPGGVDRPHFAAFFDPTAEGTPGNAYLEALLRALAEPGRAPPQAPAFDFETIAFLDENQGALTASELIRVADLLGVATSPGA